jgi:hypothetical protein
VIAVLGAAASALAVVIVASVVTILRTPDDMFDVFVEVDG